MGKCACRKRKRQVAKRMKTNFDFTVFSDLLCCSHFCALPLEVRAARLLTEKTR